MPQRSGGFQFKLRVVSRLPIARCRQESPTSCLIASNPATSLLLFSCAAFSIGLRLGPTSVTELYGCTNTLAYTDPTSSRRSNWLCPPHGPWDEHLAERPGPRASALFFVTGAAAAAAASHWVRLYSRGPCIPKPRGRATCLWPQCGFGLLHRTDRQALPHNQNLRPARRACSSQRRRLLLTGSGHAADGANLQVMAWQPDMEPSTIPTTSRM